jgi:DNA-binding transcriptional MerR regulator
MPRTLTQTTFDFSADEVEKVPPAAEQPVKPEIARERKSQLMAKGKSEPPIKKAGNKLNAKRGRRSLKEISMSPDNVNVPEDDILFAKQYYSIGEVSAMFGENQSLIRYWETEFDILQPRKNRKGDRYFRPVDIKNLVLIYDLLRRRKFTIEGAKTYLKKSNASKGNKAEGNFEMIQSLDRVKNFLMQLKANL